MCACVKVRIDQNKNKMNDEILEVKDSGPLKQTTLFKHNFTRSVTHNGENVRVVTSGEDFVPDQNPYRCSKCPESFRSRSGLTSHEYWKHPTKSQQPVISDFIASWSQKGDANVNAADVQNPAADDELIVTGVTNAPNVDASNERTEEEEEEVVEVGPGRKGAGKRKSYTYKFKMEVLTDLDSGMVPDNVAIKHNIHKSLVSKWKSEKKKILDGATAQHTKLKTKGRKSTKHDDMFKKLLVKFREARSKGKMVCFAWLYTNAAKLHKELHPNKPRLSPSVAVSFLRKYKIKLRRAQRKRQKPRSSHVPILHQWHSELREGLIKTGSQLPFYDSKWGRYTPDRRFNVDQVPMPFAINRSSTYEEQVEKDQRKHHKVWIGQPSGGLEKRQCSLQVCISPSSETWVKLAIIFRGTGKRITEDEKRSYHPAVDVYFQKCAWADREVCTEWIKKTLKPVVEGKDEFLLFCDNLDGQTFEGFRDKISELNGRVRFGPKNLTESWQPVDSGFGHLLKVLSKDEQQQWLECDDNVDRWLGNTEQKFSAKERRILITQWVGEAYERLKDPKYNHVRWRSFERTGCLITSDGSDDDKIKPEGLNDYKVPPPLSINTAQDPFEDVAPEPAPIPEDDVVGVDEEEAMDLGDDGEVLDVGLASDSEEDRDYNHNLVGCNVKVFYAEFGWYVGEIKYFNNKTEKLVVYFSEDDSEDFVSEDDINGVDVLLLT